MSGLLQILLRFNARELVLRPRRALLTVTGLAAGVALLFSTLAIDATLRDAIDTTVRGLAGRAQLEVAAPSGAGLTPATARAVAAMPGVAASVPVVRATTRVRAAGASAWVVLLGVPRDLPRLFAGRLGRAGEQIGALRAGTLLAGPRLAAGIAAAPGRQLTVEVPGGETTVQAAGQLATVPFAELNGGAFAVVALDTADALFSRHRRVDAIYVIAARGTSAATLATALRRRLGGRAVVGTPGSQAQAYRRTFDSVSRLTELAGAACLWVAALVVLATMSIAVTERRRAIATQFALGATRGQIAGAFVAEAAIVGAVGAVLGLAGGVALASTQLHRSMRDFPLLPLTATGSLHVTAGAVAAASLGGVAIAVLGAALPARRIMRTAPTEAMRRQASYEWRAPAAQQPGWRIALAGLAGVAAGIAGAIASARLAAGAWLGGASMLALLTGAALLLVRIVPLTFRLLRGPAGRALGPVGLLSADALARNPRRTTITVGALALSAATAIGLGTALGSFESQLTHSFNRWYGPPLYVSAHSSDGLTANQPLPGQTVTELERVPGVQAVYPWRFATLSLGHAQAILSAIPVEKQAREGFTSALDDTHDSAESAVVAGLLTGGIVISRYTAARRGLRVGDTLALPTPGGERPVPVIGVFDDLVSIESMYMEHAAYEHVFGDESVDRVAIAPAPGVSLAQLETRLDRFLAQRRIPASVQTRAALIHAILDSVRGVFSIARGIQLIALLIAGLIVAAAALTTVAERRWELALSRALGMTRAQLRNGVLLEAAAVGVVGALIATVLGLGIGLVVLRAMEARFSWSIAYRAPIAPIATTLGAGVSIALLAAALPSRIAGRTPIVATLQAD